MLSMVVPSASSSKTSSTISLSLKKMSDTSSPTTPPVVKRACDACHRRKVKCISNGTASCKNCTSAGLSCTYNAIPQKKGPKGSRAKVITELRERQRQSKLQSNTDPPASPSALQRSNLLSIGTISACVDFFFANLYPTQPILHRQKITEAVAQMEYNVEAYCLISSLCGYMMIQPNMLLAPDVLVDPKMPATSTELGQTLISETLRLRRNFNYIETPTVWSVITSFFLFGSFFCLDKHNTAWFHLREATTLAQIMGMHQESNYQSQDWIADSRKRRLYWLLFVTERAYALQQHRPLTLYSTINPPTLEEDPTEEIELSGFIHLVNLFRPFDDTFVGLWNRTREGCTTGFLAQLQQQLSTALPIYLQSTESQAVDLRCSQQWLRTMVWQLSISQGLLSSSAADKALSFQFPIEISRDLVSATSSFSQTAMEVHGIGLIEKLFDVACTLTDVMACVPIEQQTFEFGPKDYLNQLMSLISNLRGGKERYLPLLVNKINDTMPSAPSYGLGLPAAPTNNPRVEEIYESHSGSEFSRSGESSPWNSPPAPIELPPVGDFQDYGFPMVPPAVTSAPHYGEMIAPQPTGGYPAPILSTYTAPDVEPS